MGSGSGSGSGAGAEAISEQLWDLISFEISRCVLEILDNCLGAFHAEIMAIIGAHTLSFQDFHAYGACHNSKPERRKSSGAEDVMYSNTTIV